MIDYNFLRRKLDMKQEVEKIILEIEYIFILLKEKKAKVKDLIATNNFTKEEYIELIDIAVHFLQEKTNLKLTRKDDILYRL